MAHILGTSFIIVWARTHHSGR